MTRRFLLIAAAALLVPAAVYAAEKSSTPEPRLAARIEARQAAPFFMDKDCADFVTHTAAQAFYEAEGGPRFDPHGLDADHDGSACEALAG